MDYRKRHNPNREGSATTAQFATVAHSNSAFLDAKTLIVETSSGEGSRIQSGRGPRQSWAMAASNPRNAAEHFGWMVLPAVNRECIRTLRTPPGLSTTTKRSRRRRCTSDA